MWGSITSQLNSDRRGGRAGACPARGGEQPGEPRDTPIGVFVRDTNGHVQQSRLVTCQLRGAVTIPSVTPGNRHAQLLGVVVVSPGDVATERDAVVSVVDELNRRVAASQGYHLTVWRWETDARPGLHLEGPQGLIDDRRSMTRIS